MSYLGSAAVTSVLLYLELSAFAAWSGNYSVEAGYWFPYLAVQAWVGLHFLMFPVRKGE